MAGNTTKEMMFQKKPLDEFEKRLDTTSELFHQAADGRNTTPGDDVTHCPLHLTLDGEDTSPSRMQPLIWMNHPTNSPMVPDRLRWLIEELYQHDPHAADQLSNARTEQDFLSSLCRLFDLSHALTFSRTWAQDQPDLANAIVHFMSQNLHIDPTLKTLAAFLGYSEMYCPDLFRSTIGESFSCYLKRLRTEPAAALLRTTDQSIREIASALRFSDQFTFSHFFKRSMGQSPRAFRTTRTHRRPFRS